MGRWEISRSRARTRVTYRRGAARDDCGDQRPDTPVQMIVDWISARALVGDVVAVDGRLQLVVMPEARA